ncbi:MAG: hypothetical protein U0795_08185 [Pirellulales bacterium]
MNGITDGIHWMTALAPVWGQTVSNTRYEWVPLLSLDQWWQLMVLLGGLLGVAAFVGWMYRRDGIELPAGVRWSLTALRLLAFGGLLAYFLNLELRTERSLVKESRLAVLLDTSQSMSVEDVTDSETGQPLSRASLLARLMQNRPTIDQWRQRHTVVVYTFDQTTAPTEVAVLPRRQSEQDQQSANPTQVPLTLSDVGLFRRILWGAAAVLGLSLVAAAIHTFGRWGRGAEGESWALLASVVLLFIALIVGAVAHARYPALAGAWHLLRPGAEPSDEELARLARIADVRSPKSSDDTAGADAAQQVDPQQGLQWADILQPRGASTRLGDAVLWTLDRERGGPLAGIVLVTDGRENAGTDWEAARQAASEANIAVYTVGLGAETLPANVRVVDLEAPKRAYPRDRFEITGYLQGSGWENRSLDVQLLTADGPDPAAATSLVERKQVTMGKDGELIPVAFNVSSEQLGPRTYRLQLSPSDDDLHAYDNQKDAQVQITENKTRVLLLAGGPNREYQFVRNLLYRDEDITLDVWLQSATKGTAQESDTLLTGFPDTEAAMFAYDCVVAYDPDWTQLTSSQIDLLERWVGEKAGGLVLVAGNINLPQWAESRTPDNRFAKLQDLYPVVFYRSGLAGIKLGRDEADKSWPLKITDEGRSAPFLSLADDPAEGLRVWDEFEGVYAYYAVREVKPGARVLASFSDPQTAVDDRLPPYIVSQLYGAGRVVFMGSAEMWRLRELSDAYFELFYTKLIRYCSEGRLLLDSSRGTLLASQDRYQLGETVVLQASLSDEQFRPLQLAEVPATVILPDGTRQPLVFRPMQSGARPGSYVGQFTATREGDYRVELVIPGGDLEVLTRNVQVRIPQLEIENPQRNAVLLVQLAQQTGGRYWEEVKDAFATQDTAGLATIEARSQEIPLPASSDQRFQQVWRGWLMAWICTALLLEWLVRRLYKLA